MLQVPIMSMMGLRNTPETFESLYQLMYEKLRKILTINRIEMRTRLGQINII